MRSRLKRALRAVWILAGLSVTAWMILGFQAVDLPGGTLQSDRFVAVRTLDGGLDFQALVNPRPAGLIFLPGGMVDPLAYAPLLKRIAAAGYPARLLYLPMRCACTDAQVRRLFLQVQAVLAAAPRTRWLLAGHSRGAMLAARFIYEIGPSPAGLALLATTHPRDFSLARLAIPVAKIYGSRDGIAPHAKMLRNQGLLPPQTTWVRIEGGNHVQFGHYRHQFGDGSASITRAQQQDALASAILQLLAALPPPAPSR